MKKTIEEVRFASKLKFNGKPVKVTFKPGSRQQKFVPSRRHQLAAKPVENPRPVERPNRMFVEKPNPPTTPMNDGHGEYDEKINGCLSRAEFLEMKELERKELELELEALARGINGKNSVPHPRPQATRPERRRSYR